MQNELYFNKIEAYIRGNLPPSEQLAFEAELRQNTALQKALVLHSLQTPVPGEPPTPSRARQIVQEISAVAGPLPPPSLTWLDTLRYRFYSPLVAGLAGLALLLLVLIGMGRSLPADEALIQSSFFDPANVSQAGGPREQQADYAQLSRASNAYWLHEAGRLDSLQQMASSCKTFCLAHYFLAHAAFQAGRYSAARDGFDRCVEGQDVLALYRETEDIGKVKFNRLLAAWGASRDRAEARRQLQAFLSDPDCQGDVRAAAEKLHKALGHPLRFLK